MRFALLGGLFLGLAVSLPAAASGEQAPFKDMHWSFEGPFGTYNRADLQHGFQVYKDVCSACHSLNRVAFHTLAEAGGPGFTPAEMKAIAAGYKIPAEPNNMGETVNDKGERLTRLGIPADHFPAPFANDEAARAVNGGALPPDLSLIVKARVGGPQYIYSLLVGFDEKAPAGFKVTDGKYYNPYFIGWDIGMPAPLSDGQVTFVDGAPNKVADEAYAVVTFLSWAAEPHLEERHRIGLGVMIFLVVLSGMLYLTYRRVWKDEH